jgi:hypothetical protein
MKETEWAESEALMSEFVERSSASTRPEAPHSISRPSGPVSVDRTRSSDSDSHDDPLPPEGQLGRDDPAQDESLAIVGSALMTAVTAMLWYLAHVLSLDS